MTYDKRSLKPGSYDGLADVFALREVLEFSKSRVDAESYLSSIKRTWGMWVGVGDYSTKVLDLVGYQQASSVVYTDETINQVTGQYFKHIAYVDKHPQPSGDSTLPIALTDFYGNITLETSKTIIKYHETGDVHIASYDFAAKQMYVAIGRINRKGQYGPEDSTDLNVWKAYNRPYLSFQLKDLWTGN